MAPLLLLVLITQLAINAERSAADRELPSVPIPTNVRIKAYNLNAILHWDYPVMPQIPVFTVQMKTYWKATWIDVCSTSLHQCDIFSRITHPSSPLWARVKARLGQEESAYAESNEFILCKEWKIGPPKLNIRQKENRIIIDIFQPFDNVNEQEPEAIYDEENPCYLLTYNVYVRINGTQISNRTYNLKEDDCNETQCHLSVPVSLLNSEHCISAEGVSETIWPLKTEKSKELCITILDHNSVKDTFWIPIVAAVLLFLVLTLIVVCCNIKKINPFKRKTIMLPKSLVSVVKIASSETKSESKYLSPITYEPIVLESEKVIWEEQQFPESVSSTQTEDAPGKGGHKDLSSETEVVIIEENTCDMAEKVDSVQSGSNVSEPCSFALNSYHSRNGSDSGLVGSDSLSDSECPPNNNNEVNTSEPEPVMLRNTATSFGYDKPHVLVDLPVDEGGKEESLVGYRVTAAS